MKHGSSRVWVLDVRSNCRVHSTCTRVSNYDDRKVLTHADIIAALDASKTVNEAAKRLRIHFSTLAYYCRKPGAGVLPRHYWACRNRGVAIRTSKARDARKKKHNDTGREEHLSGYGQGATT